MRIGEFADICNTKISILRHYDKEGILIPDFIDKFSGYRYYSPNQIDTFNKITALKKAGFSLSDIKIILSSADNTQLILDSIERKQSELLETLSNLKEAKLIMLGVKNMSHIRVIKREHDNGLELQLSVPIPIENIQKYYKQLEEYAYTNDYQRISNYKTYSDNDSNQIDVVIDVVKLHPELNYLNDDSNLPFENDDVVGKWVVMGEYAVKEDFYPDIRLGNPPYGDINRNIYFLPQGESYWCYSWTKGYFIVNSGDGTAVNSYEVEEYNGERYMFIQNKSYYYRRGGRPTILVLRQFDHKEYSRDGS